MSVRAKAGDVQTVTGPISPAQLGVTLTHEHLLMDLSYGRESPTEAVARALYDAPVSLQNLGYIRHYAAANADNSRLLDVDTAIQEAALYKQHGGNSLVDATSIGISRDPIALARISRQTGLNIIMGASYYVDSYHPAGMDDMSEDDIAAKIVEDVSEGVDGTGIRAGIIGEVGCSWPLTDNERKTLRASGVAQRLTGAPLLIHPGRDERAPLEIIEVLSEAGADLTRTIIGHLDRTVFDRGILRRVAESGCFLEWDLFGREQSFYAFDLAIDMPSDAQRMDTIAWVISEGFGDRIVVAHDICSKHRLVRYGGHGYFYILAHIVPRMRARGYDEEAVRRILVGNPAAALTFAEPEAA
jgi:phosphotriesterase-related protein